MKFPRGLKEIGRSAFYKCETLNEIDLTKTKVKTIGQYAFYNCFNIKTVTLSDTLEKISDYAFYEYEDNLEELNYTYIMEHHSFFE